MLQHRIPRVAKVQSQIEHEAQQRELAKKLMSEHEKRTQALIDENCVRS